MRSDRRRGGLLGRLEERAEGRLGAGGDIGILGSLCPSAVADFEARVEAVRTWAFEVEVTTAIEAREASEVDEVEAVKEVEAQEDGQRPTVLGGSRRVRVSTRRRSARRAASSAEEGQSSRGQGRRRTGRRSTSK